MSNKGISDSFITQDEANVINSKSDTQLPLFRVTKQIPTLLKNLNKVNHKKNI